MQADDLRLLGIPRSRLIIAIIYPYHDARSQITQTFQSRIELVACISVARVRPRTSKGITDLLLPQTSTGCNPSSPSKKLSADTEYRRNYLAG